MNEVKDVAGITGERLKAFIDRIEILEEEKASIAEDIKKVYSAAKANGFDAKIMKMIVRLRKKSREERQEEEALLDLYLNAVGME